MLLQGFIGMSLSGGGMALKLQGQYYFSAHRAEVWKSLNDPVTLAKAIPGGKTFKPLGNDRYAITMELGIPAIKGTYKGYAEITNKVAPKSYTIHIVASGATGTVDATAHIDLQDQQAGTLASYTGEAKVSGALAGAGSRILSGIGKIIIGQFFKSLDRMVQR